MRRFTVAACTVLVTLLLLVSGIHAEDRYLEGRMLGASSQGGYLLKLDDGARLQVKDVVAVVRDGVTLGRAMVTSVATDGSAVLTLQFSGSLRSTDRFVYVGRYDPSWTYSEDSGSSSGDSSGSGSSLDIHVVGRVICAAGACTVRVSNRTVRLTTVALRDLHGRSGWVICTDGEVRQLMGALHEALSRLPSAPSRATLIGRLVESDGRSMGVYISRADSGPIIGLVTARYGEPTAVCLLRRSDALDVIRLVEQARSY